MSIPLSSSAELRAFDATARSGSMSAAAKLLGLRQPTVSAHIASLERNYGVELFHRRGSRIELTGFGAMLREVTHRIFRGEEQAAALLLGARSSYEGVLKLGAIGPHNVTPMVARFRQSHPQVRVAVAIGDSRTVAARVLDQQDDLGLLLHAVDDPRVHCVPYRRQSLIVFAPVGHLLARRAQLTLHDLQGHEFVVREEGSRTRQTFDAGLAAAGVSIRKSVEMGSREGRARGSRPRAGPGSRCADRLRPRSPARGAGHHRDGDAYACPCDLLARTARRRAHRGIPARC